jgi:hypothetical protein
MCFAGSPPKDNSAEIARQQEAERQDRINAGRAKIDETFGQFNEPFFDERQKSYTGYFMPQLDDQYHDTRRKAVLSLARTGNLNSGSGARQLGDLQEQYELNRGAIADKSLDFGNQARTSVENARQDLYTTNRASADPSGAAASALSRAGTLTTAPAFSPLGNVFADFINNISRGVKFEREGLRGLNTGLFPADKRSVTNVRT